jgi:hypothetical protein
MRRRQPDNRIHRWELGSWTPVGGTKRFVVNLRRGVPYNACVETFRNGALRCWASHNWLDNEAAAFVRDNATQTDKGAFVWDEGVKVSETRRG